MGVSTIVTIKEESEPNRLLTREPDVELLHVLGGEVSGDCGLVINFERNPFDTARHCRNKLLK